MLARREWTDVIVPPHSVSVDRWNRCFGKCRKHRAVVRAIVRRLVLTIHGSDDPGNRARIHHDVQWSDSIALSVVVVAALLLSRRQQKYHGSIVGVVRRLNNV